MISVQNRLPEPGKENRVSITPDSGSPLEGVLAYADDATQEGTFWNRKTAQLLQGDIRTYPVRDGQSISAGDVVNVGQEIISGTTYGDLAVGSTVQINENGSPVDYIVVHQGNPDPDMYDASCNGTWLLRKDIAENRVWDAGNVNQYADSDINAYLNGDWLDRYDSTTLGNIKEVKIPYCVGGGSTTVNSGANGLSVKSFQLSGIEVGFEFSASLYPADGSKLDYFSAGVDSTAREKRLAAFNGSPAMQFTRSSRADSSTVILGIDQSGYRDDTLANESGGLRPCIIYNSSALLGDDIVYGPDTIYKDVVPQDNVENVFHTSAVTDTDTCYLNGQYSVTVVTASNSNNVFAYLIDNTTGKSISSEVISLYSGKATSISVARLDDSHFVVCWLYSGVIYGKVGTVTGTTISLPEGSSYDIDPFQITGNNVCVLGQPDRSDNNGIPCRIYIGSTSSGLEFYIQRVGASGSSVYRLSSITKANYISACFISNDDSGNQRVCVCFSDANDGNKGKAVIATIDSSNAVTFGDVVTFDENNSSFIDCCVSNGFIVVAYQQILSGNNAAIKVLSDPALEIQNSALLYDSSTGANYISILPTKNGIAYIQGSIVNGTPQSRIVTIPALEIGDNYGFNNAPSSYLSSTLISENKILLAYADANNSNYGTTTILEVLGNQIAGSFVDISSDAIALADGTGGQEIPVGFGGYCECPGVTEGDTIDSSGVSAFSPLDGWLSITDARNKALVTGEYIGTHETVWFLDVGFKPSVLLIQQIGPISGSGSQTSNYIVFVDGVSYGSPFSNVSGIVYVTFTDTGVSFNSNTLNNQNYKYYYAAWR